MQIARIILIGGLWGLSIGLFGHGLKNLLRGNVNIATITWTVVGALGTAGMLLWYWKAKRDSRGEIQEKEG